MRVGLDVLSLIKQGISLNKISKKTGINKSTLYPHYKKIYGKKNKPLNLNLSDAQLAEFLGIFAGDGCFSKDSKYYHYTIRIFTGYYEREYSSILYNLFSLWFGKPPQQYIKLYKQKPSVVVTQYHSKALYELLKTHLSWKNKKTYNVHLKSLNLENREFNLNFLRGLLDTDGCYARSKNTLSFSTVSFQLITQISAILEYYLQKKLLFRCIKKKGVLCCILQPYMEILPEE